MSSIITKLHRALCPNAFGINGKSKRDTVNLERWNFTENCGDYLSKVVVEWMLEQRGIPFNKKVKSTKHLLAIGSVLGMGKFDATVWGSGIHRVESIHNILIHKQVYDIRALRGPLTGSVMRQVGKECRIYGDPAILMPLIYKPKTDEKKYTCSLIPHISTLSKYRYESEFHIISMNTNDYQEIINQICLSEKVISTSLHGLILAESYGVPAVFYNDGMDSELFKYYDWYFSTNRYNVKMIRNLDEIDEIGWMELPQLESMRTELIAAFPYDLWQE